MVPFNHNFNSSRIVTEFESQLNAQFVNSRYKIMYKPAVFFTDKYGISSATLRRWAETKRLECIRLLGGKRMYSLEGTLALLGNPAPPTSSSGDDGHDGRTKVVYARVSSAKQHPDLERQVQDLKKAYPNHELIQDIGSGVNFKRRGLHTLLERVLEGLVSEVVVMHRDRLTRLGFELFDFIFSKMGVKLVVHCSTSAEPDEDDLASDLLAITTVFVASHNGRRAAANKKRRRLEEEQDHCDGDEASQASSIV